jgi:DnaK suppressor protein
MGPVMKKKDLDFFKKHLQQRMQELLNQADDTVSGMTTTNENFPDQALERIENGTYGICESCGEEISIKRLKARPVTTQCIECKAKEESLEKALGI